MAHTKRETDKVLWKNQGSKTFGELRKSVYASINGTKGNLIKLSKSSLLNKTEKEKLEKVISAVEDLRAEFCSYKNKTNEQ